MTTPQECAFNKYHRQSVVTMPVQEDGVVVSRCGGRKPATQLPPAMPPAASAVRLRLLAACSQASMCGFCNALLDYLTLSPPPVARHRWRQRCSLQPPPHHDAASSTGRIISRSSAVPICHVSIRDQ